MSCGPKYPDISGDWVITEHSCAPEEVGMEFTGEQDEADFTVIIVEDEVEIKAGEGTIDEDGNIEIDGEIDGEPTEITGEYDEEDETLTLVAAGEEDCNVVAERK